VWIHVEYEKDDGETGIYAVYPAFKDVVAPEWSTNRINALRRVFCSRYY
jgi:hypothetical protein